MRTSLPVGHTFAPMAQTTRGSGSPRNRRQVPVVRADWGPSLNTSYRILVPVRPSVSCPRSSAGRVDSFGRTRAKDAAGTGSPYAVGPVCSRCYRSALSRLPSGQTTGVRMSRKPGFGHGVPPIGPGPRGKSLRPRAARAPSGAPVRRAPAGSCHLSSCSGFSSRW